jgi:hypothetical protein
MVKHCMQKRRFHGVNNIRKRPSVLPTANIFGKTVFSLLENNGSRKVNVLVEDMFTFA